MDNRPCLAENEREREPHQIIHDLVKLFFLVVSSVDGLGLLNGLHVEQNFQLLVEHIWLMTTPSKRFAATLSSVVFPTLRLP